MGSIRKVLPPEESPTPLMSLERARRAGLDVSKIRTCAVPQKAGDTFAVKGCSCAEKCSKDGFGLVHLGGFGPHPGQNGQAVPGAGGEGPENVPYYRYDSASKTEKEDFIPCYGWFVALHDQYEQQRNTGDVIEVLGREKETRIVQLEVLPADPNANKNGNSMMTETPKPVVVPGFRQTDGLSARMDYALAIRRNRQQQAIATGGQRLGPGPSVDPDAAPLPVPAVEPEVEINLDPEPGAAPEVEVGEVTSARRVDVPSRGRRG